MAEIIPIGTVVKAALDIADPRMMLPYIYAGEEVTIMGHVKVQGEELPWEPNGYIIRNANGLQVVVTQEDVTLGSVPPPKTVEQRVAEAFREGYSQGHSRGLTCGRLYGGDDQYIVVIQVATREYLRELRGENDRFDW